MITPNLTEACLLTGAAMPEEPLSPGAAEDLLAALREWTGARTALITGVQTPSGAANIWMGEDHEARAAFFQRERGSYPGTGDLFAAVLAGALAHGAELAGAIGLAAEFVRRCVSSANRLGTDAREGVPFEAELPFLTRWAAGQKE